ncbi:MAG TPA: hypothetical protein ENK43_09470 [Planctomycetes bacterium]|nr:hypothetical protein [Planctomycetota bacterium]
MKNLSFVRGLVLVMGVALAMTSCGGGSGGGGGGGGGSVEEITVQGVGAPIYTNGQAPQPVCPQGAFLNARVSIKFSGPVDPSSLPPDGPAQAGSIQIVNTTTNAGAMGVFSVDAMDPSIVHFTALPPSDPAQGCNAGMVPNAVYTVFVPDQTSGVAQVIQVGGAPVSQAVTTCFGVVSCGAPGDNPFTDSDPNPPAIVATTPAMDATAPLTSQSAIAFTPSSSQIIIDVDQALEPTTVNQNTVFLVNTTANPNNPIPQAGTIEFTQFGFIPGENVSRIKITTTLPVGDGDVYEVRFNGVADLGGQALTVPAGTLLFTVQNNMNPMPQTFVENFDTTTNRGPITGEAAWDGNGNVSATFPLEIVGDGTDGMGMFNTSVTINTDMTPTNDPGIYNFTDLTIGDPLNFGVMISFMSTTDVAPGESNVAIRLRSQAGVDILDGAQIICNGRPGASGGTAPPSSSSNRLGGWGGPGAGAGGIASPNTDGTASPAGNPGEGGHISATDPNLPGDQVNTSPGNPLYGGGGGGAIGAAPNFNDAAAGGGGGTASSFGGYGGANPAPSPSFTFTAATAGEPHLGNDGMGGGAPPPGQPGPIPLAMIPPLQKAIGGSGGGAGGDRVTVAANVATHIPGGAGGGGGGACRISAGQDITIGTACQLRVDGGDGGNAGGVFAGKGAGGSGGSLILQAFGDINLGIGPILSARGAFGSGGNPPSSTLNGDGGRGGDGVLQLQDGSVNFMSVLATNAVIATGEFVGSLLSLGSGGLTGVAESLPIDTGSASPDYTSGSAVINLGTIATATVTVEVVGIAEDPTSPGNPATTAMAADGTPLMSSPTPLSQLDVLDGYRFFKIIITLTYPPPPASTLSDVLPNVDSVTINYET